MTYGHGIYPFEVPTSLVPPRRVDSAIPVVFGTAPGPTEGTLPVNEPVLCFSMTEYVAAFGYDEDWEKYTLCEFATAYFVDYGMCPAVFVNVYDPAVHKTGEISDPTVVTGDDIIGGVDADTLEKTGLELINEVFPKYRIIPGSIVAPGFSDEPAVAISMSSKASLINGIFKAMAIIDIPESVTKYTDTPSYKETSNLTDEHMIVCFPKVKKGDKIYHLSSHVAALLARVDHDAEGIPFRSPSNQRMEITGNDLAGNELRLGLDEANYLNSQGIITAMNWDGGWKCWGNRTACYPSNTDPKDSFIPVRRFFNWHSNTFILTYFSKVDWPLTRRLLTTIMDSENIRLNSFASREIILGGRIEILESENPTTDLMDGIVRFHTYMTPPSPAREIINILEYDPKYISTLFK
ncbi:phage tail sheath family protein [Maridesulfovibrio ferrireducens]|uniref:phage tail sheath family protein n=1 Tax=Maridesulfovibrio ferrireducens TaxID=246191 RepID=UPI001A218A58|nr:phage tail sheath family protein [Maridesulfovibrio ferrireducens]MBI9112250.1 phage tail sheath family protein [Maridesulfovibrio ferrireducens]